MQIRKYTVRPKKLLVRQLFQRTPIEFVGDVPIDGFIKTHHQPRRGNLVSFGARLARPEASTTTRLLEKGGKQTRNGKAGSWCLDDGIMAMLGFLGDLQPSLHCLPGWMFSPFAFNLPTGYFACYGPLDDRLLFVFHRHNTNVLDHQVMTTRWWFSSDKFSSFQANKLLSLSLVATCDCTTRQRVDCEYIVEITLQKGWAMLLEPFVPSWNY